MDFLKNEKIEDISSGFFIGMYLIYNIMLVSDIKPSGFIIKYTTKHQGKYSYLLPDYNITVLLVIFSMMYFDSYDYLFCNWKLVHPSLSPSTV